MPEGQAENSTVFTPFPSARTCPIEQVKIPATDSVTSLSVDRMMAGKPALTWDAEY
jgi:hypothetical protein